MFSKCCPILPDKIKRVVYETADQSLINAIKTYTLELLAQIDAMIQLKSGIDLFLILKCLTVVALLMWITEQLKIVWCIVKCWLNKIFGKCSKLTSCDSASDSSTSDSSTSDTSTSDSSTTLTSTCKSKSNKHSSQ